MKKLLVIALVLVAFFIFLYGCGEVKNTSSEGSVLYTELLKSDIFGKAFKNIGNSCTFALFQLRFLTFPFPGKSIQNTIMTLRGILRRIPNQ